MEGTSHLMKDLLLLTMAVAVVTTEEPVHKKNRMCVLDKSCCKNEFFAQIIRRRGLERNTRADHALGPPLRRHRHFHLVTTRLADLGTTTAQTETQQMQQSEMQQVRRRN